MAGRHLRVGTPLRSGRREFREYRDLECFEADIIREPIVRRGFAVKPGKRILTEPCRSRGDEP